jgi:hypothetical protein
MRDFHQSVRFLSAEKSKKKKRKTVNPNQKIEIGFTPSEILRIDSVRRGFARNFNRAS